MHQFKWRLPKRWVFFVMNKLLIMMYIGPIWRVIWQSTPSTKGSTEQVENRIIDWWSHRPWRSRHCWVDIRRCWWNKRVICWNKECRRSRRWNWSGGDADSWRVQWRGEFCRGDGKARAVDWVLDDLSFLDFADFGETALEVVSSALDIYPMGTALKVDSVTHEGERASSELSELTSLSRSTTLFRLAARLRGRTGGSVVASGLYLLLFSLSLSSPFLLNVGVLTRDSDFRCA